MFSHIVGPIVRIGPNELHSIDNTWNLQHHRRRDLKKYPNYYGVLNSLLGGFHEPQHHGARGYTIRPLYNGERLAKFSADKLNSFIDKLYEHLQGPAEKNNKVNASHALWAYTTDIMLSYVIGKDSGFLESDNLADFHDSTRALGIIGFATIVRTMPAVLAIIRFLPFLEKNYPYITGLRR